LSIQEAIDFGQHWVGVDSQGSRLSNQVGAMLVWDIRGIHRIIATAPAWISVRFKAKGFGYAERRTSDVEP
jgi:hypothetical protein